MLNIERIASHLSSLNEGGLIHSKLQHFGIHVVQFDLESDDASREVCTPWSRESFDEAFAKLKDHHRPEPPFEEEGEDEPLCGPIGNYRMVRWCERYLCAYTGSRWLPGRLASQRQWVQRARDDTIPYRRCVFKSDNFSYPIHWTMGTTFQVIGHKKQHIGAMLMDEDEATESLRRSELFIAIHLMSCAMERSTTAVHIPAMVYSIAGGHQARIIHAYFERNKFIVKLSNYVKIWRDHENEIKLYLRWMLNDPVGAETDIDADRPDRWDGQKLAVFPQRGAR